MPSTTRRATSGVATPTSAGPAPDPAPALSPDVPPEEQPCARVPAHRPDRGAGVRSRGAAGGRSTTSGDGQAALTGGTSSWPEGAAGASRLSCRPASAASAVVAAAQLTTVAQATG